MKHFWLFAVLVPLFYFTACDKFSNARCQNTCPENQIQQDDCTCYLPQKTPATEAQQQEFLQAILNNNEQGIKNLLKSNISPDSPISLSVLADQKPFKNIYAKNIDIFTRLNYQNNNLTLLSLLAPLENFNSAFKLLLKQGADPNLQAFAGLTPLQIAISADRGDKVKMLLESGAKIDTEGSVFTDTMNLKKFKALQALSLYVKENKLPFNFPAYYFIDAMINNRFELANAVAPLMNKEILNTPNNFGVLPLVQAAFFNNTQLMDSLIANGADINLKADAMRTPLLAYLQEVYIAQIEGNFPKGQEEKITAVAKHFLDKGADRNAKDENGEDIMFYAVRGENIPLLEILFSEYKHDINTKNNQGETPLFTAAQNSPSVVNWLLQRGANPKIMDYNGRTPAIAAVEMGNMEIYDLLESAAATTI